MGPTMCFTLVILDRIYNESYFFCKSEFPKVRSLGTGPTFRLTTPKERPPRAGWMNNSQLSLFGVAVKEHDSKLPDYGYLSK